MIVLCMVLSFLNRSDVEATDTKDIACCTCGGWTTLSPPPSLD